MNDDRVTFEQAVQLLRSKFDRDEDAARALRLRAITGALEGRAGHALIKTASGTFGIEESSETRTDFSIDGATWEGTREPSSLAQDWKFGSFTATVGGYGPGRRTIVMTGVSLYRAAVDEMANSMPDVARISSPLLTEIAQPAPGPSAASLERQKVALAGMLRSTIRAHSSGTTVASQPEAASPPSRKGGAPRDAEKWEAVAIALVRLAVDGRLDRNISEGFETQAELRRSILDDPTVAALDVKEETIKPFVRKVWFAVVETP